MGDRQLLDCTLRDGGYVNDWEFGHANILEIFERLVSSGVEFIEVGFLDQRRQFDINRTILPDTESFNKVFAGIDKGASQVVAMIDYGTCGIEHLQPAAETFIDGIRVIFKEHLRDEALAFCAQVKALGYKVFAQLVSVTTYTDEALVEYAECCNRVMPFATSMVDTYGLLDEAQLLHIFSILDRHVDPAIKIGYHAHNNFQLGFANAKAFLGSKTSRSILADGTLYGMGKSAGNAPLELLMKYMNEQHGAHYDLGQALEAIDNVITPIYKKQYWGYNAFFFISAEAKCHPNYVSFLMNKRTLSIKQVTELLEKITPTKKLMYDEKYIERLYIDYQNIACDDSAAIAQLTQRLAGRDIVLLGPGSRLYRQQEQVQRYIKEHAPVVIAVNFVPENFATDYLFLSNTKRYNQLISGRQALGGESAIIATSNVIKTSGQFDYVLNYSSLIDPSTDIIDNSLVMLLKALLKLGAGRVALAGFDGYSPSEDNYYDISREYSYVKEKSSYLNSYVSDFLRTVADRLQVEFITDTLYTY